jgi:hypothetical protein
MSKVCRFISFAASSYPEAQTAASEFRRSTTSKIYNVCDDRDPRIGFNALTVTAVETAFDTCLKNAAPVNPGTSSLVQTQASSIQENS